MMKPKENYLMVLAVAILISSLQTTEASTSGVRGTLNKKLDSYAVNRDNDIDSPERKLKSSKSMKSSKSGSTEPPGGRLDIPSPTPAPAPTNPTLSDWIDGCTRENSNINICESNDSYLCKNCLHALSFTSVTPSTANGSVNACKQNFCGDCDTEKLMQFFDCGYGISNPISDAEIPLIDSSIRTPPPSNVTDVTSFDDNIDLDNCPAIYPRNGTECLMLEGYEFKKCFYWNVGTDVVCNCSKNETVWECTGTITNEEFIVKTEDLEVTIEEEAEVAILPTIDVVFSRIDTSEENSAALFCPITAPKIGDSCSTGDFASFECCYQAVEPYPNTLGTITCTCSNDGIEGFQCKGGSLSTCTLS